MPTLSFDNLSDKPVPVYLLKSDKQRDLILTDETGRTVAKTRYGKQQTEDPGPDTMTGRKARRNNYKRWQFAPKRDVMFGIPSIVDCFEIQKPGNYKLKVIPRIYFVGTNDVLKLTNLPSVTIDVIVKTAGEGGHE